MVDRPAEATTQPATSWRVADGCGLVALVVFCICALLIGIRSWNKWRSREYEFAPKHAKQRSGSLQIPEGDETVSVAIYYVPRKNAFFVLRSNSVGERGEPSRIAVRSDDIVITDHRGNRAHAKNFPAHGMERPSIEYEMEGASLVRPSTFGSSPPDYYLTLQVSYELDGPRSVESEKLYPRPGERYPFGCASVGEGLFLLAVYGLLFISGAIAFPLVGSRLLQWHEERKATGAPTSAGSSGGERAPSE